jgi:hypothetical protein
MFTIIDNDIELNTIAINIFDAISLLLMVNIIHSAIPMILRIGKKKPVLCFRAHSFHHVMCNMRLTSYLLYCGAMHLYLMARLHLAMLLMRDLGIGKRKPVLCSSVHSLHVMCIMVLKSYRL